MDSKTLDGSQIIDSWFPKIKANIFLSHSHNDKEETIVFAGWLKKTFNLTTFIDSCIWGYGNDLIQMIDNKYSWLDKENRIYSYNKVLSSSSHVHMMVATALSSMIDKTECLIFYDTPNSIKSFDKGKRTESPWIYSEIAFSETVRKTTPERIKIINESQKFYNFDGDDTPEKVLKVSYELNYKHLKEIDHTVLNEWKKNKSVSQKEKALDRLYEITFPKIKRL
ncbi:hypothetical protein [Psychroflexus sp. MES1-P1E]|uniref:hypothetical protein n=1 Tax=Psychroflexus sp. MES1-P1E TaxID=2058320 RepID=UPI0011AE1B2D|nr:hypothetical protein [Psychroflexus sp. MES1-P1E]